MQSKGRRKELDEVERLEKKIRELKSINRSLMKQVKKLNRGYYKLKEEDLIEEKDIPQEVKKMCYDCGVGNYNEHIIANRRFRMCDNCGKRGKVTIINKSP